MFVNQGLLRAHSVYLLLAAGLAAHLQPLCFLVGLACALAARLVSQAEWEARAAKQELVMLTSKQCGESEEWKPRGLVQVLCAC